MTVSKVVWAVPNNEELAEEKEKGEGKGGGEGFVYDESVVENYLYVLAALKLLSDGPKSAKSFLSGFFLNFILF